PHSEGLQERAHEFFFSRVGASDRDAAWRECFTDWFHFDWRVPVMGGCTLLQATLQEPDLDEETRRLLSEWEDAHPSFYTVEGVAEEEAGEEDAPRLTLREIVTGRMMQVDWMRLGGPVGP